MSLPRKVGQEGGEGLLEAGPDTGRIDGDVVEARNGGEDGATGQPEGPAAAVADEGAEALADAGQAGGIAGKGKGDKAQASMAF